MERNNNSNKGLFICLQVVEVFFLPRPILQYVSSATTFWPALPPL